MKFEKQEGLDSVVDFDSQTGFGEGRWKEVWRVMEKSLHLGASSKWEAVWMRSGRMKNVLHHGLQIHRGWWRESGHCSWLDSPFSRTGKGNER